jgi:hypothetical protein
LFGSATRGDFDPDRSDYDFLVEFEALPPGQSSETRISVSRSSRRRLCGMRLEAANGLAFDRQGGWRPMDGCRRAALTRRSPH